MATDIIREYLIKLGVDVSASEINKLEKTLSNTDKAIVSFFKRWNHSFVVFSRAYTNFISKLVKFNINIAQNDMYMQRWAKTMYLTADSARALDRTLSAMGLGVDDLRDVALNPELTRQYKELLSLSKSLTVGEPLERASRKFREISFEFQRIKVVLEYFRDKILAYTWRFMESTAGKSLSKLLRVFSTDGVRLLDKGAQILGNMMGRFISGATRLLEIGGVLYREIIRPIKSFFDSLGPMGNAIVSFFSDIALAILGGPFGRVLVAIQWFVELVDDYLIWKSGGKSALPKLWGSTSSKDDIPEAEWQEIDKKTGTKLFSTVGKMGEGAWNLTNKLVEPIANSILENLSLKPQLQPSLPADFDDAARESYERELRERSPQTQSFNNTPINIYIDGAKDPRAVAENTVALIRSYKGVYA